MPGEHEQDQDLEVIEKEARNLGWVPEDQFKGDKSRWVSAEEFVEKGKTLIPLLTQNNRKLQAELLKRDEKIDTLASQLQSATVAIDKLEKHYTAANKRNVEVLREQLRGQVKTAREDNDVDAELAAKEKLDEINASLAEMKKNEEAPKPKVEEQPQEGVLSPELTSWMKENPWYGDAGDKKKTRLFNRFCEDLKEDDPDFINLVGRPFLDGALELFNEEHGETKQSPAGKVDGGSNRGAGGGRGGGGKGSFNSLPQDAKQACLDDADDLVGAGKRYPTLDKWKEAYAKIYFSEE